MGGMIDKAVEFELWKLYQIGYDVYWSPEIFFTIQHFFATARDDLI